ncbi:MAG: indolepyruvate ferredoxin oxidoreductase [Spirochaetes bacterium GWC1_61_12]|nr:MAG: indolepyruvate ferredoxin oxidoreductase [Spirochaetes bacterium GWB1_60_80]OHD34560.1 MAG: indolepyruvate ferredoxin oxidoreductase [Spirochaetes bacterium GWC1_61_12]OHD46171.1 MAG: indolepyruvate ferredoxin oxidoreductase [Spirochaetes bacterium GWE1_60_18]OHD60709.1 MAG: indolepyruvate ferredoxin oxidoreductase [Spirochaetes bacterium GWF1_60_12]HAP43903.1 indolepyruvate ferredoxin oxidoreductase [Spirochaetaceae bacterium]
MKELGPMLLQPEAFSELTMGNTALVRAMLEAGVGVVTSYPGSPTPEIAEAIRAIPAERRPFYFEFSTNEKVATEVAFGAAVNGHLAVVFFKSVGLNVAADSFVQLPLMKIGGGLVVVLGDDPGANSSQNEQDNRHYARLAYCPLFEPASAAEAYTMFKQAAVLARELESVVILRLTTHVCHYKEQIDFAAWPVLELDRRPRFDPEASNYIPIAASVFPLKQRALERLQTLERRLGQLGFDRLLDHGNRDRGIIVAGLPFASVMDVLETLPGGTARPDILKLGAIFPFDRAAVAAFLRSHREVKVIEELDPILEGDIKALAWDEGISCRLVGRQSLGEAMGECTPDKAAAVLHAAWPELFPAPSLAAVLSEGRALPPRPAQLCPGCGHRSAFFAIKQALRADDISVADIGCHTLGYLPPYRMGQVLLSMGHSTSTAAGLALFNDSRRVICFMGDSTFFHAGLPGIANAVYNRHRLLLVVLENGTTAMTGHQDHPGTGRNFNGDTERLTVKAALAGLGVANLREIDAYKQAELTVMVRMALDEPGFKVIIARHPCMLKFTREARRKPGWALRHVMIDQAACNQAHICVESFACPSFQRAADGQVTVSPDLCIGDGSCRQTCPASAIVAEAGK